VKIKGTCRLCGRAFFAEQVIANGGQCPWDGQPLQPDYAPVLVEALREAEKAGTRFEHAIEKIADMNPAFDIDEESVLGVIHHHVQRLASGARTGVRA
jgi:hypothetical protein